MVIEAKNGCLKSVIGKGIRIMKKLILISVLLLSSNGWADTEETGDILSLLIPSIAFAETVFYEEGYGGSADFMKIFVTSQILTEGLKASIHKRRPNGNCCDSFPSGHSSRAFVGASFIHRRYGFKYSVPAYIAASYVAYSRVDADKHEVEDVITGALVGILSSYIFYIEPYKNFTVTPVVEDGDVWGVSFRKKF